MMDSCNSVVNSLGRWKNSSPLIIPLQPIINTKAVNIDEAETILNMNIIIICRPSEVIFKITELSVTLIMDLPGVMKGKGIETKVTQARINMIILIQGRRGVFVKIMMSMLSNNISKGNSKL